MDLTPRGVLPLAIPLVILVIILLRNRRPRPLHLSRMWILPTLVVLGIGMGLYFNPHPPFGSWAYASFALALGLGALAGWWRGRTIDIHRDAETGQLMATPSPLGLILIVVLLISRRGLDAYLEANAVSWHLNAGAIADAFMLFAVGLVVTQRIEMFLRARAIMAGDRSTPDELRV